MLDYARQLAKPFVPEAVRAWRRRRLRSNQTNAEIFSRIYRTKAWGGDGDLDFFSGNIPAVVDGYVAGVRCYLESRPPADIVDIGSGDFVAGSRLFDLSRSYVACDVVPEIIERNRRKFQHTRVEFIALDATCDPLPRGEIVLIKQVLQHLRNEQISAILRQLAPFKTWIVSEHLPSGAFTPNLDMGTGATVRRHCGINSGIVLTAPPFSIKPQREQVLAHVNAHDGIITTVAYEF
jgi:hypothetical protein